jgi:DNA-binding transcriptional LysR family regulator
MAVSLLSAPFCAQHPLVNVRVFSDLSSRDILRRLRDFDIDAGITYIDPDITESFHTVPLYHERYVLLAGVSDGPARSAGVTWAEASRLPLCMLHAEMQGRRVLDAFFADAGVRVAPRVETDSVASLYAHVRTGRWAAVMPQAWLHVFGVPRWMRAMELTEPSRSTPIGLVIPAREPEPVMARALADLARRTDVAADLGRLTEAGRSPGRE